jgi:serine protease inhibitor
MKTESSLLSLDLSADFKFSSKVKVLVNIPKFKMESSHDLKNVLRALGMTSMFDEGKADFSEMTKAVRLSVSSFMQVKSKARTRRKFDNLTFPTFHLESFH